MALFRLLFFLALGYLIYRLWRVLRRPFVDDDRQIAGQSEAIVRCEYCDLHVPKHEALTDGTRTFCCREHQQAFQRKHEG